jgi:hypothetical protein
MDSNKNKRGQALRWAPAVLLLLLGVPGTVTIGQLIPTFYAIAHSISLTPVIHLAVALSLACTSMLARGRIGLHSKALGRAR